ncbi:Levanase precursor [Aquisphaera giovannonii]|uniref:Levanase n=1 Tax=Aquisphaera giovannonii TaxID=406548 RepID=A0A5B9WF75_9BACT|nr:GH32 C-terminal domain-containing protein [Aquisphaera giovannonii]QEH38715.1 Levanase precursor [Aquisphaera giovannonii]
MRFRVLPLPLLAVALIASAAAAPPAAEAPHREMTITQRYLHLPVRNGATKRRVQVAVDGKVVRDFDIELDGERPDFVAFDDVDALRGKAVEIRVVGNAEGVGKALEAIAQADEIPDAGNLYREAGRPQFHFTSRRGWHNDPNGLVWQSGLYHMFYQHNPYGWGWGNMHWGHAVSPDLVHWTELGDAIRPREYNDWAFSGSAVVDHANTGGFQAGASPALVAAYTSTGRGECIVFSNDGGRTFAEYDGNPVVKHNGRDPKLVWYAPGKHWVMAVYDEAKDKQRIAFYTSNDLKRWALQSKIDGYFECPDLFELPVDGDASKTRWVLSAADGKYALGDFDGKAFHVTSGPSKLQNRYGNYYAAQSFSDVPDGRRIQVGWGQNVIFPGMPFNQQMTLPAQLTLRTADGGIRLFAEPVKELEALRGAKHESNGLTIKPGGDENPLREVSGELLEIAAEIVPAKAGTVTLDLRGTPVVYDAAKGELACKDVRAPLPAKDGRVRLRIFVDRGSVEVFGNDGRVALSVATGAAGPGKPLGISAAGEPAEMPSLTVYELKSAWPR